MTKKNLKISQVRSTAETPPKKKKKKKNIPEIGLTLFLEKKQRLAL